MLWIFTILHLATKTREQDANWARVVVRHGIKDAQQRAAVHSNALAMKQHKLDVALMVDRAESGGRGGEGGMEQWHWW